MSLASSMAALSQNNLTGKMLNCHKEKYVHFIELSILALF